MTSEARDREMALALQVGHCLASPLVDPTRETWCWSRVAVQVLAGEVVQVCTARGWCTAQGWCTVLARCTALARCLWTRWGRARRRWPSSCHCRMWWVA